MYKEHLDDTFLELGTASWKESGEIVRRWAYRGNDICKNYSNAGEKQ